PDASGDVVAGVGARDDLTGTVDGCAGGGGVATGDGAGGGDRLEASASAARAVPVADRCVADLARVAAGRVGPAVEQQRAGDASADDQHDRVGVLAGPAEHMLGPARGADIVVEGDGKPEP